MANYSTSANVILTVNGKQAQKMLSQLEKDAKRLENGIAKAAVAGDKATMKKLQRELNSTRKAMEQLKGTASTAEQVLLRLNKATPKQLNTALRQLQQQLNGLQRGTAAWDAHVAKIRMLKAELQKVNATLATQKSLWQRFNGWLNGAQTAIMAVVAAITGLIMAGRKAVQSYSDIEETMANTIKYTRMTAAEVEELNEIFKGMDTRLAREQLNLLAQEGGRLGYNTVASVREYVEAASIINVALVDLGEGATQTIAKLSNIFGMEQMYGVRDSMLKIGSTVNRQAFYRGVRAAYGRHRLDRQNDYPRDYGFCRDARRARPKGGNVGHGIAAYHYGAVQETCRNGEKSRAGNQLFY